VATDDQNPDLQLTALKRAGCKRIFTDKASGVHGTRPELTQCLKALNAGDMLIIWKLDRLGRSLRNLIALLADLKVRGIAFRSLTEAIDTATPAGWAMWQMVGILAELEQSLIQERTKAGRAAARARSMKMGRKPKLSPQQVAHARMLLEQGERPAHVAHQLKVLWRTSQGCTRCGTPTGCNVIPPRGLHNGAQAGGNPQYRCQRL
jgi:DNA invertase Pin-like site-specific DNA recombinase